jgi:hypothetical protein
MREPTHEVGGTTVHVGDCYVWAAIFYLDSPTDYRECLPYGRPSAAEPSRELLMLDHVTPVSLIVTAKVLASIVSAGIILGTIVVALRL